MGFTFFEPHHWALFNSHQSSTSGSYKGFTKRLLSSRRKRIKGDIDLTETTKQVWSTTSDNGDDHSECIGHDALVLSSDSGYPIGIRRRAKLWVRQNVLSAHSGHPGPALPIGPSLTLYLTLMPQKLDESSEDQHRDTEGGPSSQKRPQGTPEKSGGTSKKPRKGKKNADRAQNGRDGGDGEEDEGDLKRDGPRFPWPDIPPKPKSFACPLWRYHPARYDKCKEFHLSALSYVTQHLFRKHVLQECTVDPPESAPSNGDSLLRPKTVKDANQIVRYCHNCRDEWHGSEAAEKYDLHVSAKVKCEKKTIEQTGVLLPQEFLDLKQKLKNLPEGEKWSTIWATLFPGVDPLSQYKEPETVTRIENYAQSDIPHQPFQHITVDATYQSYHPSAPQGYAQGTLGFSYSPVPYSGNNRLPDPLTNWPMAANIGGFSNGASHIPNSVSANAPMGPVQSDLGLFQSLFSVAPTENATFPTNDWNPNNHHGS
ncbi:hypothetical protein FBEOM_8408 [Fusarium beomiforme]|uniref:Uncharacterized protein n=1 Tax=Fusarium beomiforme TaxID=44412 RepID=A0A9P5AF85_9HYPO|nr:hypothetical protein FBEOM_8408 [Fusarium beomiforme]